MTTTDALAGARDRHEARAADARDRGVDWLAASTNSTYFLGKAAGYLLVALVDELAAVRLELERLGRDVAGAIDDPAHRQ